MAQAQLDRIKFQKNVAIQTGDRNELTINLSKTKRFHMYYSKSYKDYVISFNFTNCRKFIISRSMWKIFRKYINIIDGELNR
jgi:predicted nucleic acid-binding Zn finger protein